MPVDKKTEAETQDHVADYYEEVRYKLDFSRKYHSWWSEKMLSFLTQKGLVLDNGCGTGNMFRMLQDSDLIGSDISQRMLLKAKSRMNKLVRSDSQTLPFKDDSFDVILARSLLHHLPDPASGLEEMYRVLKASGEIVIVDTNKSVLSTLPRRIIGRGEHFSEEHKNFRYDEILTLLEKRFRVDEIYFFGYIAYPLIGFPDLVPLFRFVPFQMSFASLLIKLDELISKIPFVNRQSWGVMIKASIK